MLRKIILFSLPFVFTVAAEAALQENGPFGIGDEVYVVDSHQPSQLFTLGRVGEVIDINNGAGPLAITMLKVQFDNSDIQTYNNGDLNDLYVSEGCLPADAFRTGKSEVCVSENIPINIHLISDSGDVHISLSGYPQARILAINKSNKSIMVRFLEFTTADLLSGGRPVVYSVDDITKYPRFGW